MAQKGPQRLLLEKYLLSAAPDSIEDATEGFRVYVERMRDAAISLNRAAAVISGEAEGGRLSGQTFLSAGHAFGLSSDRMADDSEVVEPAAPAVSRSSTTVRKMQKLLDGMKEVPDNPPPTDPMMAGTDEGIKADAERQAQVNANEAAMAEQEAQSAAAVKEIDGDYAQAVDEMKKIHGIPDPPPATPGTGSPQSSSSSSPVFTGPRSGTDGTIGHGDRVDPVRDPDRDPRGPRTGLDPDDGTTIGSTTGTTTTGTGTRGDGTTGVGDRVTLPPNGNPFPGVETSGSGSGSGSATASGSGGLSTAATAGIIGGAAGIGGLGAALGKGLAARGMKVPGLSGQAGKIGAGGRAAGSAVTGRAGSATGAAGTRGGAASGSRTGSGAGGAGGAARGSGTRGGAGAGAQGKPGGRGAGGGRGGAGAGAGGGGRGSKKDRTKGDVWDQVEDGDQWIDDDGAGHSILD